MAAENRKRKELELEEEADELQEMFDEVERRRKVLRKKAKEECAKIQDMLRPLLPDEWKDMKIECDVTSSEGDVCVSHPDGHWIHFCYEKKDNEVDVWFEEGEGRLVSRLKKQCKDLRVRLNKTDDDALAIKDTLRWFESLSKHDMVQNDRY